MLYFPDDEIKEKEYGASFWLLNQVNYTNRHLTDTDEEKKFKLENKISYKTPFISNSLYLFLRNDSSWHSVEPVNISGNHIRKSLNINFIYQN